MALIPQKQAKQSPNISDHLNYKRPLKNDSKSRHTMRTKSYFYCAVDLKKPQKIHSKTEKPKPQLNFPETKQNPGDRDTDRRSTERHSGLPTVFVAKMN